MKKTEDPVLGGSSVETTTQQPSARNASDDSPVSAPSPYDHLLKNGTAILEAPTREELEELVENIPADYRYSVGAVGRKQDGTAYTIRIDIV